LAAGTPTKAFADAGAVHIAGPANAKAELVKHTEHQAPALSAKIVGVETVDHPTYVELVAHARRFFKVDDQMPPRIRLRVVLLCALANC